MAEKMDYCQYYLYKLEYMSLRGKIRETYKSIDDILKTYESSLCYLKNPDYRNECLVEAISLFMKESSERFYDLDADANKVLKRSIVRISNARTYEDIFGSLTDFMWVMASTRLCRKRKPGCMINMTDNVVMENRSAMDWIGEIKGKIDSLKYDLSCMKEVDNLPLYKRMMPGLIENDDVAWFANWHNISYSERKQNMYDSKEYIDILERVYFAFLVTNIYCEELRRRYR